MGLFSSFLHDRIAGQFCHAASRIIGRKMLASIFGAALLTVFAVGNVNAALYAYVPNSGNQTASAIDTSTQTQTTVISGMGTTYSAAVAPNGSVAYVADFSNNRIFPINTTTNTAGAAIAVGTNPVNVTFSSDSTKAYVSNYGANSISVVDVASGTVSTTVAAVCPNTPVQTTFHGAKLLIVCNSSPSTVRIMDTANGNALSDLATVGNSAYNIAISTTSGFGYVTNYGAASVSKFDLTTGATTTYPATGVNNPLGLAVTPDGSKIFIGDYSGNNLIVMDPNGNISATMNMGGQIAGIGRSSNGSVMYVPIKGLATGIKVINASSNTVTGTIANPGANPQLIWGDFLGNVAAPATAAPSAPVNPSKMTINGTSEATDALYPGNFASPVANPVHFTFSFPGCANGELHLAMSAPALGLPWSYLDGSLHWRPLPAYLDQITPFVTTFADNGTQQELYSGYLPPGIYDFFLVCDSRNGHLDIQTRGTGPALTGMYVHRRIMVY
ncbi:MAG: YncE family protein [Gammaproteobacteria bacterium]|nr:YncE family protein [Gammaproteobacteria bacterium]MBU1731662.1 YncE family protein [Gammaproteobacteria bacterium]MBU1892684.1 YncE family protein [Gammaproteobacteria bacterium]